MSVTNYYTANGMILGERTGGGGFRKYTTDALGSTLMTTNSSGTQENSYRYKPYGTQLVKSGSAADPGFLWVGSLGYRMTSRLGAESYVRARHYGSSAHWTSSDPIVSAVSGRAGPLQQVALQAIPGFSVAAKPFGYVGGSPVTRTDPEGLWWVGLCLGGIAAIIFGAWVNVCHGIDGYGNDGYIGTAGAGGGFYAGGAARPGLAFGSGNFSDPPTAGLGVHGSIGLGLDLAGDIDLGGLFDSGNKNGDVTSGSGGCGLKGGVGLGGGAMIGVEGSGSFVLYNIPSVGRAILSGLGSLISTLSPKGPTMTPLVH